MLIPPLVAWTCARTGGGSSLFVDNNLCAAVVVRYISVNVEKHNRFSREGADVLSDETISLHDAVNGCKLVSRPYSASAYSSKCIYIYTYTFDN